MLYVIPTYCVSCNKQSRLVGCGQGCGVGVGGVACFQLESESVFKTAGVGSLSRFFKSAGVGVGFSAGVGTFVAITDSNVY